MYIYIDCKNFYTFSINYIVYETKRNVINQCFSILTQKNLSTRLKQFRGFENPMNSGKILKRLFEIPLAR